MSELERGHRLAAENRESVELDGAEFSGWVVEDEEGADADAVGGGERGSCVETEGSTGEKIPPGAKEGVVAGVGDLVDVLGAEQRQAGEAAEGEFGLLDADAGGEPDAVGGGEGEAGGGGVAGAGCEFGEVVDGRVGRGAEDLVFFEGLEAQSFTARNFAFTNVAFILPLHRMGWGWGGTLTLLGKCV